MSKNILITSGGRRVSLARGFAESVADSDIEVWVADMDPEFSAAAHDQQRFFALPAVEAEDYESALLEACQERDIGLVVPTIDTELAKLAMLKGRFQSLGIQVVVSDASFIDICADKRKTHSFFTEAGFAAPRIFPRDQVTFPLFAKPYDGSLSSNTHVILDETDLTPRIHEDPKNIFMEYLDPASYDEYTCDLYYNRASKLICSVPRKRLHVRGGEVAKAIAERLNITEELSSRLGSIPGAQGVLTLQLFRERSSGHIVMNEINARFGGGYPLARLSGADYQKWLVDEYLLQREVTEPFDGWVDQTLMLRFDDEICVIP